MRQWLIRARVPGLLVLGALIGGCAVLTIDVDVYKGPLVNDEAVQVEQVAVMAIGAKPLLIQLRDQLWDRFETPKSRPEKSCIREGPTADRAQVFKNAQTRLINAVLCLYEDRFPDELAPLLRVGGASFETMTEAFFTVRPVRPEDGDKDRMLWETVSPALRPEATGKDPTTADNDLVALKNAYESFLLATERGWEDGRPWRDQVKIYAAHQKLLETERHKAALKGLEQPLDLPHDRGSSANSEFEVLSRGALPKAHADLLFQPGKDREKQAFVSRVREIGKAFLDFRTASQDLLRLTLTGISLIRSPAFKPPVPIEQLHWAGARFAASLVNPKDLWFALENRRAGAAVAAFRDAFLTTGGREVYRRTYPSRSDPSYHEALARALLDQDGSRAHALLLAHATYAQGYEPPDPPDDFLEAERGEKKLEKDRKYRCDPKTALRRFGIAAAPLDLADAKEITDLLGNFTGQLAGGFERGRLDFGLETLIERYLQAKDARERQNRRNDLLDAMVHFAEKVLFVANFSLLVDSAEIRKDGFLLQAVGNSILTQVDELKRLARRDEQQKERAKVEVSARREVWDRLKEQHMSKTPPRPSSSPKEEDPQNKPAFPKEEKLALDPAIAELRYLYLNALTGGPGDRTKLLEAIREAYEQRSRMIYLRPASAFLRNSYPVTSLQRDSKAIWANLLTEHAYRQLFGARGDRGDVKAIQEFDKQFWQNVNTVRVAGAGRTNYVLVKDDVGNWYVKNFAADPEPIIKAAKSMALFAAGGSISADAISRAADKIEGKPTGEAQGEDAAARLLERQRQAAAKKAETETTNLLAELRTLKQDSKGLRTRIETEWTRRGIQDTEQLKLLNVAIDLSQETCRALADDQPPGKALDRELEGLKACWDKIVFNLDSNLIQRELRRRAAAPGAQPASPQVELTEDDITKAKDAVKTVVRELGVSFIQRREQIVKDQTTRLKAILEESSH